MGLALLLGATQPVLAAPAVSARDAGTYISAAVQRVPKADTTAGYQERPLAPPRLIAPGTYICARLHSHFGMHLSVPAGTWPLTIVFTHPPMTNTSGQIQVQDVMHTTVKAGESHYVGWSFEDPNRLLPGRWHISVMSGGQVVLDQPFTIDFSCTVPVT